MSSHVNPLHAPFEIVGTQLWMDGGSVPLDGIDYVDVKEGTDFTVPFIEIVAAMLLIAAGLGFALVGGTLSWAVAPWIPGGLLLGMAIHAALAGSGTLYGLTLHRGRSEQIVWYSRDRHLVDRMADKIRAMCV